MSKRAITAILLALILCGGAASGQPSYDLAEMSLEELMDVEVFTASRRAQPLFESAAAAEVVTGEDIRRSGAVRLPEALRLASGVHVKHIDASKWAITTRGFANRFANKLLVLIDGRTVYSPLFAGVFWEVQDLLLDDVDHIEVIRGPGGALWGANAVNGVINILTRPADETQGSAIWAKYGPEERGYVAARHGGRLRENISYRVYGKAFRRDALALVDGRPAADPWHMLRGGFRADGEHGADTWTLSGETYTGRLSQTMEQGVSLTPPYARVFDYETDVSGAHLLGRYIRRPTARAELRLTGYYDGSTRSDVVFGGAWRTVGLDLQHRFPLGRRQTAIWGGELRSTWDSLEQTERFSFVPPSRTTRIFSAFLQDEIRFFASRCRLILGTKLEHNDFTGAELLPSARCLWTDAGKYAIWGAVSRAVRLPTRAETEGHYLERVTPFDDTPNAILFVARLTGNPDMREEELLAWELGGRLRPAAGLTLDLAGFYNRYDHHFSGEPGSIVADTLSSPPQLIATFTSGNLISGHTLGGELNAEWRIHHRWRLRGGYAYLRMDLEKEPESRDPGTLEFLGDNPRHRALLHSLLDLPHDTELDAIFQYLGRLPYGWDDRILNLDLRLAWHPHPALELALVAQNFLGTGNDGLDPELIDTEATYSQRSLFASLAYRFRDSR